MCSLKVWFSQNTKRQQEGLIGYLIQFEMSRGWYLNLESVSRAVLAAKMEYNLLCF